MRNRIRLASAGIITACAAVAAPIALAPQASAAVKNCGIVTCSVYLSRSETRASVAPATAAAIGAGIWGPGPVKIIGGGLGWYAFKADEAAGKNMCLRIRYTKPSRWTNNMPIVTGLYADHNAVFCRD